MDNANARLAKDRNGADIPNKPLFIQNEKKNPYIAQASGALQKNQNGADIPGKDTFTKNIGGCAKAHGLMQIIRSLQIQVAEIFVLQVLWWKLLALAAQ
ncbi:Mu prophage; Tail fiber protein [Escherichia coli]|nr:Mu prophage; Tail fiber protein [Escherichia coli]